MERLTMRSPIDNGILIRQKNGDFTSFCCGCRYINVCKNQCSEVKTFEKLADYEDAEEQGLLMRLPCKVGDTVWVYFNYANSEIQKAEVKIIEFGNFTFGNVRYLIEHINRRGGLFKYYDRDFGESIFLTREAAEQALKEMEDGNAD